MNYLSLFSGIGGFEYGIQQSNKNEQLNCIGYSEVNKYAENIYRRHFPNHPRLGDAKQITPETLQDFDLLVGGFPCQSFSVAGQRRGFDDMRGTLFFEIARILKAKKPRYILLENVKGLLSHDKGNTFKTILRTLSELGYDVRWEILNSKNFGVPQNRERLFIKGFLTTRGGGRREVLSIRQASKESTTRRGEDKGVEWQYGRTRQFKLINPEKNSLTITATGQNSGYNQIIRVDKNTISNERDREEKRLFHPSGLSPTITHHHSPLITTTPVDESRVATTTSDGNLYTITTKQRGCKLEKRQDNYIIQDNKLLLRNNTKKGYIETEVGDGIGIAHYDGRGRVRQGHSPALDTSCSVGTLTQDYRIRRLTPIECERLQGFPDNYTQTGYDNTPISDTQRYRCLGNAVTTNVITAIINNWDMQLN